MSNPVQYYHYKKTFPLETGGSLPELTIGYHTYGKLNRSKSNVVWICHALTANSDPADWWNCLVGKGKYLDPGKYFIVCANILGSCYGTTGPLSINKTTGNPFYHDFPFFTLRDMISAHRLLQEHLEIDKIHLGIGGSMGGSQLLEWEVAAPGTFDHLALIASNAKESPWAIALHTAQRMAIEADQTWQNRAEDAGIEGLKAARAMGIPTYRNYKTFEATQQDNPEKLDEFRASTYQRHQGNKLAARFNAFSYYNLLKALDTHNIGRGRGELSSVLASIRSSTLVIAIQSDILYPLEEQKLIADQIPDATFTTIDSLYGHDGFLIEGESISKKLNDFLSKKVDYLSVKEG